MHELQVAFWIQIASYQLLHELLVIFYMPVTSYYSLHELQVTFYKRVTVYYLLHKIRVHFWELQDRPTKPNTVILVAIVTEEDILSSAQFTNKSSKMLLPAICVPIYSIYLTLVCFGSSRSYMKELPLKTAQNSQNGNYAGVSILLKTFRGFAENKARLNSI